MFLYTTERAQQNVTFAARLRRSSRGANARRAAVQRIAARARAGAQVCAPAALIGAADLIGVGSVARAGGRGLAAQQVEVALIAADAAVAVPSRGAHGRVDLELLATVAREVAQVDTAGEGAILVMQQSLGATQLRSTTET